MAQKVFDFGAVFTFEGLNESEAKINQARDLMRLVDMGILDAAGAREAFLLGEASGENPWLQQAKEIGAKKYARVAVTEEKVEPPPGKRKIIL